LMYRNSSFFCDLRLGIDPLSRLLLSDSPSNSVKVSRLGIDPLSLLLLKYRFLKLVRAVRLGIDPLSSFEERSSKASFV